MPYRRNNDNFIDYYGIKKQTLNQIDFKTCIPNHLYDWIEIFEMFRDEDEYKSK